MKGHIKQVDVIVPISGRHDNLIELHRKYAGALIGGGVDARFVYVLDGDFPKAEKDVMTLASEGQPVTLLSLGRWFGESAALSAGLQHCAADWIITLPSYYQVAPERLADLFENNPTSDVIIGRRWPRLDSKFNQILTRSFHSLVRWMTGVYCTDLGSDVRLIRKQVLEEVPIRRSASISPYSRSPTRVFYYRGRYTAGTGREVPSSAKNRSSYQASTGSRERILSR